jgi:poly(3-hydroxybutyrate) depolymerase
MAGLITTAEGRLQESTKRARAHENSAEYHRRRDAVIGSAARIVSAVVGAGIFVGLVSKLGLDGKGSLSVPAGWEWLYWTVLAVALAAPALTALQVALHDADDAAKHTASFSEYRRLADDIELFVAQPGLDSSTAERAYRQFIAKFEKTLASSLPLTAKAKKDVGLD